MRKREQKAKLLALMEQVRVEPDKAADRPTLIQWLRRPEATASDLGGWAEAALGEMPVREVLSNIEVEAKYSGYILQQERQIERLRRAEERRIPDQFGYSRLPGLSREISEKLERVRPSTLGQAGRIPGVTPAAIAVLDVYLSLGAPVTPQEG
jgi:tRNA uridine 5-carboxymethylaminomethyl modification enzyme